MLMHASAQKEMYKTQMQVNFTTRRFLGDSEGSVLFLCCQDDVWLYVHVHGRGSCSLLSSVGRTGSGSVVAQLAESVAGQISWRTVQRGCGTSQQRALGRQATAQAFLTTPPPSPQFDKIYIFSHSPSTCCGMHTVNVEVWSFRERQTGSCR